MPFTARADGRTYDLLPATDNDPTPLESTGKLYCKFDGGIAQLFFQSDNGVVYQITPGGAAVYPFELPEIGADPAPLANTGKLYTKDVGGVSQLFFLADNGAVSQISPNAGTTAARPVIPGQIATGGMYFDTTLGFPIWSNGVNYVDAAGAIV